MSEFKEHIEDRVNNKPFDYHRDDTSIGGVLRHKKGDEYFFNGKTDIADISLESADTALITIPYSGNYRRKHFIGVFNEYRTEERNISGKFRVRLTLKMFGSNIEDLGLHDTAGDMSDPNHDAHKSAKAGLLEDVISNLRVGDFIQRLTSSSEILSVTLNEGELEKLAKKRGWNS